MKKTFILETNMTVATTKVGAIQITIPSGSPIHLKTVGVSISAGPVAVNLLEDYSFTDVLESPLTPLHANRQLADSSNVTVKGYVDITAVAGAGALTVAQKNLITATSVPQDVISNVILLKPSTNYLLAFTNSNAGDSVVNFALSWEE